tara:strand:+ start:438 stop:2216 length:1779 start_codon:yes stop_codon:yes gene_type:complete
MIKNDKSIRIGCASAFWGDTSSAAYQLINKGNLNYLVFDFLAEVTMSILARAKMKNPDMGYTPDFINQIAPHLTEIKKKNIKVISNAGGINLEACRDALKIEAEKLNIDLKIILVRGDNIIDRKQELQNMNIRDIDNGETLPDEILSMNGYLGATPIQEALANGADIVITGRCVDTALVLGPLMHEFNWGAKDYNLLAAGSLAGHIIECGAQCTGGNFTDWHLIDEFENMGFPIVEVQKNGNFVVSKPERTGGLVNFGTVAEQFLYEIGDPNAYILPDVVCDFSKVEIKEIGHNQVSVSGSKGLAPSETYKVSTTYQDGFRVAATLVIGGKNALKKSEIVSEAILSKTNKILDQKGIDGIKETSISILGTDSIYAPRERAVESREVVLRVMAIHDIKEALVIFSREIAQASTGMVSGVMNFLGGRPSVSPSIKLYSFLLDKSFFKIELDIDGFLTPANITLDGSYKYNESDNNEIIYEDIETDFSVPLQQLAFARSGDKGDHANIGVIARKPIYLPYIRNGLKPEIIADYFSHLLNGEINIWDVPGISGLNILLRNSLGGGGMSSLRIDPQGKAYAQQLLEIQIPVKKEILD